jgi:hypothetical protein
MTFQHRVQRGVSAIGGGFRTLFHLVLSAAAAYATFWISKRLLYNVAFSPPSIRYGIAFAVACIAFTFFISNPISQLPGLSVSLVSYIVLPVLGYYLTYDHLVPESLASQKVWFAIGGGVLGLVLGSGLSAFAVRLKDEEQDADTPAARGAGLEK